MTDPKDISYPEKSDARGSAKKYHKRQAYYFGRHNTPESYTLFALWKERLIETGEAPPVREVKELLGRQKQALTQLDQCDAILEEREELEQRARELDEREATLRQRQESLETLEAHLLQQQQQLQFATPAAEAESTANHRWSLTPVLSVAACLLIAGSVWFMSSPPTPLVDGIPLSTDEVERVRATRDFQELKASIVSDPERARKLEERRERLIKLGPKDGKISDEDGI